MNTEGKAPNLDLKTSVMDADNKIPICLDASSAAEMHVSENYKVDINNTSSNSIMISSIMI